jgi:transposase
MNGILWVLRTGAPWRDLPERYGPWPTVYSRFRRWQQAGVWDRVLADLQALADAAGQLDWDLHFVDSTSIRAHQHAAGARKKGDSLPPTRH